MRLLYFSREFSTHDRRFLEGFVSHGWEVSYLRLSQSSLDARGVPAGVRIENAGELHALRDDEKMLAESIAGVEGVLCDVRPDVVLAGPVPSAAYLVAKTGFPALVSMSWGSDVLTEVPSCEEVARAATLALDGSAAAFGDCQAVRDALMSLSSLSRERVLVFPWGIDSEVFSPRREDSAVRRQLGWENNRVIISTRSWEPHYSINTLLEALPTVARAHPDVRLLLLGDGTLADQVHDWIGREGLTGVVHAPGRLNYEVLPQYFRAADVYVSMALSDGSSVSLLEAMATGLPAVVTRGFGNDEWVNDGTNGWTFPPGDARGLSAALKKVLDLSPGEVARLGVANRSCILERASWQDNFPLLNALLKEVALSADSRVSTSDGPPKRPH